MKELNAPDRWIEFDEQTKAPPECARTRRTMSTISDVHRPLYEVKANMFKGLGHPVRIQVLEILARAESVSVSNLLTETGLEASHMSQHLSVLRRHNLVIAERSGSQVYYRLAHPQVADLLTVSRALLAELLITTRNRLESVMSLPPLDPPSGLSGRAADSGKGR